MTLAERFESTPTPLRLPHWLRRRPPEGEGIVATQQHVHATPTVCEEARCPNRVSCFARHTATFLALGATCTRSCSFCSIAHAPQPGALDPEEPNAIAQAALALQLKHVVITQVARDDLPDQGSGQMVAIIHAVRQTIPDATVEVLTSDFSGKTTSWQTIQHAQPEVWNHNLETVERLTPYVRHKATYQRSLALLAYAHTHRYCGQIIKSGFMVGLGEREEEVYATIDALQHVGCNVVTIGQYLQSDRKKRRVHSYISPQTFRAYADYGTQQGLTMYCGPFVRSSYNADTIVAIKRVRDA